MDFFLIAYTIILLVVLLIVFIELVSRRILFANTPFIQKIFGHPMIKYSLRRIGSALISVLLAVIATFFLIRAAVDIDQLCNTRMFGGTSFKYPDYVVAARCAVFRKEMGFEGNAFQQLGTFLYAILPFPKLLCSSYFQTIDGVTYMYGENCRAFIMDLGQIFTTQITGSQSPVYVIDFIFERMAVSFPVMMAAVVVQLLLGYPLGIAMAKNKDGVVDHLGNAYIVTVEAIPGVAYYYIWMALFVGLMGLPERYDSSVFLSWIPPVLTVGLAGLTGIAFWVRRHMIDQFSSDYVKFARAKGLSETRITATHIFRNAIVPLARTFPGAVLGSLMGSFFIERIYRISGIGNLLVDANTHNEIFALQGIVIISALISVFAYLLGDIATAIADPRVRFMKE